ncbi:MAG: prolyl oligopeptidase family protein [Candidatus Hodarchaeota archaeon]
MKELNQKAIKYPETLVMSVEETLHDVKIVDEYRWLEEIKNQEVKKWLKLQNEHTRKILDQIPYREKLKARLEELLQIEHMFLPKETDSGWFFRKRGPKDQQPVLFFQSKGNSSSEIELINVNKLNSSGLISIDFWEPSSDGKLLAYGQSKGGSEWATIHIMDIQDPEKPKILKDKIERTKFTHISWDKDAGGFYYMRFPDIGEVPSGEQHFHSHIRYHKLGTNPKEDPIIYKNPDKPYEYPLFSISSDQTHMIIMSYRFITVDLYYVDLTTDPPEIHPIITDSKWMIEAHVGKENIYLKSNHDTPKFAIYKTIKEQLPIENWKCIISPVNDDIIQSFKLIGNKIAVLWLRNVTNRITIHDLNGNLEYEVKIPMNGSVEWDVVDILDFDNLFLYYQSWIDPPQIFKHKIGSEVLEKFYEKKLPINTEGIDIIHVFYSSKDKTKVHMFLLHQKGIKLNKNNPTILYGYGGFGVSLTPSFSTAFLSWIENGGIVAIANIRGGGEHGDEWHKAGRLDKKQNVFDDFIAAANYLISKGYCSPKTLGIYGGSNGGLLVGAVTVQKPELFGAVYCSVPLLDMLRYHHFSLGKTWIPEYGNPEDPEQFKWIYAYSPYQQIKEDSQYPAILFYTAEDDSRVEPIHAMKFAAKMQKIKGKKPKLIWFEPASGHGVGTPLSKTIDNTTDMLAFFLWQLKKV